MISFQTATGLVAAVIVLSGCNQTPIAPVDRRGADARTIRDMETALNRDFARNDVERLASRYTDDAVLLAPNLPPATGRQNHQVHFVVSWTAETESLGVKSSIFEGLISMHSLGIKNLLASFRTPTCRKRRRLWRER